MIIGKMRHRITLQTATATRDPDTGEQLNSWGTYLADVPAMVVPVSGKEFLSANAEQAGIEARITIRHDSGVTAAMRVVWDGKTYQIKAVMPDETARDYLVLMVMPWPI